MTLQPSRAAQFLLRLPLALVLLLSVSRCGSGLFYVEVEEKRLCKTLPNVSFFANPVPGTQTSVHQSLDYDYGQQLSSFSGNGVSTELKVTTITLTANRGIQDMNFLDEGTVDLTTGTDGGGQSTAVSYQKPPGSTAGKSVVLQGSGALDVTRFLQGGKLHLTVALKGTFPPNDWSVDIQTCVAVKARDNYL